MTKKTYTVLKAIKSDGVEHVEGDDISLEPGQAQALLGTFVEEKAPSKITHHAAPPPAPAVSGKAKGTDGL